MQTRSLKTLSRIAQVGSFAKVAEELNTTLSTVSMQMKMLEENLGVELFDRSFRPPKLTPLGRIAAKYAEDITAAEAELLSACSEIGTLSGAWRIGFIATASVRLLPDFLSKAARDAPAAQFELETALSENLETRVLNGQLDAAVVTASDELQSELRYHQLRREKLVYAAPRGFSEQPLAEIGKQLPFIQFNPNSGIGKLIATHMKTLKNAQSKSQIVLDSVEAIMECVNAGLGFTLLSKPDIRRYASTGVQVIEPAGTYIARDLVLVSAQRSSNAREIEQLATLFE